VRYSAPFTILFVFVVVAATALLRHLAAGSVPRAIEPFAKRWLNSGRDPKWIRASLWVMFWLFASTFFAVIAFLLYEAAYGLGTGFK
jgi:hypothetical protein